MIVFINGSINSGKSTLAKLLAEKIGNCAVLEIDNLRKFIEWMPIEKAIPINLENAISLIENFDKNDLNVVIPYPLSEKNYKYIKNNLKTKSKVYFFTLSLDLVEVLKDRGNRKLDDWERERIKHHYEIGINKPSFGKIINTTNQTPKETLELIIDWLN
jgi:cytidylate kinase